jgi:hypothetical protein
MDRVKAVLHRAEAARLNKDWSVGAKQARYSDDGTWYATLTRFPAALFDATGYVVFASEQEYSSSPYIRIKKQIGVPKPGISAIPGYVRILDQNPLQRGDVDIHAFEASEGNQRLVIHLLRERNQILVKKEIALKVC